MPLPEFNELEAYLINSAKSGESSSGYMWTYILSGAVLAGFAAYHGSIEMVLSAFVLVCGFRVYEERGHGKYAPVWRSIIQKYETACGGDSKNNE